MNRRLDVTSDVLTAPEDGFPAEELFAAATTAVLMADEATGRVVAVNPAAQRLLGIPRSDLVGYEWHRAFSRSCAQQLRTAARLAASSGAAVHATASGSTGGAAMTATFSTFNVSRVCYLLVQLAPSDASAIQSGTISTDVLDALDAIAVGFVVTDGALSVEFWNRAFLDVVNEPSIADIEGQCLLRWLNLTQADLARMQRQMALREAGTVMTTTLWVGPASGPMVEVTALAVPDATSPRWGFVVQKVVPH
jgi:PAS domain-containing protein